MICEWKYRRATYYALNGEDFTDKEHLNDEGLEIVERWQPEEIVADAINYGMTHTPGVMYYPGKAYMIAVQYASWIQDNFGGELLELLDDPELLPDDKYFVRYSEAKAVYDEILEITDKYGPCMDFATELPYLQKTYEYFLQEFMLDESGLSILPRNTASV